MRQLMKYLLPYKKESIIAPLFKMLEASFELLVPLVMASMIDVGIQNRDIGYITTSGLLLIGLGVLGLVSSLTAQYFSAKAAVGMGTGLRHDLFAHIQGLSYSEIDQIGTATLITRMTSDINQIQSGINLLLRLLLRSPFIVIGAMIMSFFIDGKMAFIFVVAVPVLSVVIYGIMALSIPLYKKVQKGLDKMLLTTRENLSGIRVVRAFCTQQKEKEQFEEESHALFVLQTLVGKIAGLMNPMTYLIVNVATIAIIWQGGRQVYFGYLTQGEVIAFVNYMTQILIALVALSNLIVTFTKAIASAGRVNEVFAMKASIVSGQEKTKAQEQYPEIVFEDAGIAYQGNQETSLSGINVTIQKGQTIGIIGGTGSGKTTFVNLIPRFYDTTEGSVKVQGIDVKEYSLETLRKKIGVVPQKAVLFEGTLRDNMKFGNEDATDSEIYEALEIAQAKEIVDGRKEGLDMQISPNGKNLSGGQRQRFTIARALVRKPDILILDDSASALDYATDARLRKAIAKNSGEMTVLIVSQRASSVMHADRILVFDDGQLVGSGTHEELLENCNVYEEIYSSQISQKEEVK